MRKSVMLRRGVGVAAFVTVVAAATMLVASAQTPEGCDPNVGPIAEASRFTPYEARLSHLDDVVITGVGRAAESSASQMDGLPLRWEAGDGVRSSYQYFFAGPLDQQLTLPGFLATGGIQLDRDLVTDGVPYTADDVIAQVGDRAVQVQIGGYEAALVWADPESNGVRPHHVYWTDGTYNYALIGVRSAERMVQLARGYVCGA